MPPLRFCSLLLGFVALGCGSRQGFGQRPANCSFELSRNGKSLYLHSDHWDKVYALDLKSGGHEPYLGVLPLPLATGEVSNDASGAPEKLRQGIDRLREGSAGLVIRSSADGKSAIVVRAGAMRDYSMGGQVQTDRTLHIVRPDGTNIDLTPKPYDRLHIGPQCEAGGWVYFSSDEEQYRVQKGSPPELLPTPSTAWYLSVSPNGKQIGYGVDNDFKTVSFVVADPDGKRARKLAEWPGYCHGVMFTRDGKSLLCFVEGRSMGDLTGDLTIYAVDIASSRSRKVAGFDLYTEP